MKLMICFFVSILSITTSFAEARQQQMVQCQLQSWGLDVFHRLVEEKLVQDFNAASSSIEIGEIKERKIHRLLSYRSAERAFGNGNCERATAYFERIKYVYSNVSFQKHSGENCTAKVKGLGIYGLDVKVKRMRCSN